MSEEPAVPASRRRWFVIIGGAAAVALVALVLFLPRGHREPVAPPVTAAADGGAARSAPLGPTVPLPADGVRLTGFVVDGAGLPVAGAAVTAELERGAADRALAGHADAGVASPPDAGVASAPPTTADGRFAIEGLVPGRYRLRVTGAGLLAGELRYVPVPSDEARIVVARQVAIEGTVLDGGKPVVGANVGLRGEAIGGSIEAQTDAAGAFHFANLPEGRYQLWAWRESLAARTVRVNRLGAGPFAPLTLTFEAATIVVGRVIDRAEGTGIVAAIELRPSGDDQAPRYARSGDDGVFRIEGVPNGRWIADAYAPGYTSAGGIELDAGHGIPEIDLVRGATIEGRVLDAEGHGIDGATVRALTAGTDAVEISADVDRDRLRRFSGRTAAPAPVTPGAAFDPQLIPRGELGVLVGAIPPIPPPGAQLARSAEITDATAVGLVGEPLPLPSDPAHASKWTTTSDGSYRIRGLPKGKLTVLALSPGFAEARSKLVQIDAGQLVTGIDIVVTAGTYVIGRVTDQHGAPVVGAQLAIRPEVGAPIEGFADGTGEFRLGPAVGAVVLHASAYGHGEVRRELELVSPRGPVAAERREDLVLPLADAILAGTVDDDAGAPVGAATLEIVGGAADGRRAIVATDGTFSIDLLPAGHLRVRIDHPDFPPTELDAVAADAAGVRARLVLPRGGAIEGGVLDNSSGAPLAGTTITATGPNNGTADATSDKAGQWKLARLRPGHWKLAVTVPGYVHTAREVDVPPARVPGGTSVRDIRFDLSRGAMVGGTVRDARGQRAQGTHIAIRLADGSGPAIEGDTDSQGEFRLRDCPAGELEITATRGETRGRIVQTIRPGDEVLGLALELR